MGIEKLVPTWADLEVFLQLLPRSSTGERMNPYTSMWTGVTPGDGPQDFHLVLLDNGRTAVLGDPAGRAALRCIRCSACLNVCPVYERTGGHAYGSVYPGPIGAVLSPQLTGVAEQPDPAVRVLAVRGLLRRLPGGDRHPDDARAPALTGAASGGGAGGHALGRVRDGVATSVGGRAVGLPGWAPPRAAAVAGSVRCRLRCRVGPRAATCPFRRPRASVTGGPARTDPPPPTTRAAPPAQPAGPGGGGPGGGGRVAAVGWRRIGCRRIGRSGWRRSGCGGPGGGGRVAAVRMAAVRMLRARGGRR